jgi:2-succinyl-5-enolpyruvyl-6-hydroxy-3-cyclohexene-1-carboxylate synthase
MAWVWRIGCEKLGARNWVTDVMLDGKLDFSNVNTIWVSVLVETLSQLELETAVICPGSRSAPLAIAFARHSQIEAIPILDERSAAFFALGLAKRTGKATALVCTSGTAGANFYPAVIEAREGRVPLVVLTCDRPPELRDCNAGQAIDQQKLFGDFVNWYHELAVPGLNLGLLGYVRQTMVQALERTQYPVAGAVHLNVPFREPLVPVEQAEAIAFGADFPADFFAGLAGLDRWDNPGQGEIPAWPAGRGLLIGGVAQPNDPQGYCEAIALISQRLQLPVLAEGLSPLRNYADLNPFLIATYDWLLRDGERGTELAPDYVIRVGEMPTSKVLRQWLERVQPLQWVVDGGDRNLDPLHGKTRHVRRSIGELAAAGGEVDPLQPDYLRAWLAAETVGRRSLDGAMAETDGWFEGKVAWLLSQHLPRQTQLVVANSTPIRDVEWFWRPGNLAIRAFCNRGANGIDGTLSTALGVAHRSPQGAVLLTGDLALLHDTNGFLVAQRLVGGLTIVLINNNGGGIFERLAIAQYEPPFEEFFAMPQGIDFERLCRAYGVEYRLMGDWGELVEAIGEIPAGLRVLEVRCDRKADKQWDLGLVGRLRSK